MEKLDCNGMTLLLHPFHTHLSPGSSSQRRSDRQCYQVWYTRSYSRWRRSGSSFEEHLELLDGAECSEWCSSPLLSGDDDVLELHCLNLAMIDAACSSKQARGIAFSKKQLNTRTSSKPDEMSVILSSAEKSTSWPFISPTGSYVPSVPCSHPKYRKMSSRAFDDEPTRFGAKQPLAVDFFS